MGVGANRPPLTGGQLTFGAPGVALPLSVRARWRWLGRGRLNLRNLGRFRTSVNLENLGSRSVTSVTFPLQDFMFYGYNLTLTHLLTYGTAAHTGCVLGAYWSHIGFTLVHVGFTLVHTGCADWVQSDCSDWCSNGVLKWVSHAAYAGLKIG